MRFRLSVAFLLILAGACNSIEEDPNLECDSQRACPTDFTCTADGRCTLSIGIVDAAIESPTPDGATTDASLPGSRAADARRPDAAIDAPPAASLDAPLVDTALLTAPATRVGATLARFTFTGVGAASFLCAVDEKAAVACASPFETTVAEGTHTFSVAAVGDDGPDPSPAQARWTVDVTGPVIVLEGTPADQAATNDPVAHFTLRFADAGDADGGTFLCAVDGSDPAACTSPVNMTFNADGPHIFGARGRDRAGNAGPLVTRTFTLDRAAPAVQITAPSTGLDSLGGVRQDPWTIEGAGGGPAIRACPTEKVRPCEGAWFWHGALVNP